MTIIERTQKTVARFRTCMENTENKKVRENFLYLAYGAVELTDDLLWDAHELAELNKLRDWWAEEKRELEALVWGD